MSKRRKSSFFVIMRIIGLFVMGLVVAFAVALSQVNLETLRGNVLAILRNATGMPVEIDGDVSWKFSLRPRVELNQVRIPNASWAKSDYAFSAEKIDVTIDLISLFQSTPTIRNVKVYDAVINIEEDKNGRWSVSANKDADENALDTADSGIGQIDVPAKYPVSDMGLGGVEVQNLQINIPDMSYSVAGFSIRYMEREEEREYNGWIKPVDKVYPFIVSMSPYNAERKIYPLRVAIAAGGDALIANVALEGTSKFPVDFIVRGDVPDVTAVGQIFGFDVAKIPAVSLNIAGGIDRQKLTLRKSSIAVRGSNIDLSGVYDWGAVRPNIKLDLSSKKIDLKQMFPEWYGGAKKKLNRPKNIFHDIPLFGDVLKDFDFDVRIQLGRLVMYRELDLRDMDLNAKLNSGIGRLDLGGTIAGGTIRIVSDINIDDAGKFYLDAGIRGKNISVGEILSDVKIDDAISEMPVDIEAYVMGNGMNLSEVMQSLTGPVQVVSTDAGYLHAPLAESIYGTDALTSLRHGIEDLFASDKKHDRIKVSCVTLNTILRNGRIETQYGMAAETNAINARMVGNLDLGQETIKLSLTTVPVRGLKFSLTGNVVNSIEFTGNLAEPDININGAALAGKVASATGIGLLLAPFTGGLSLLAGAGVGLLAGDLLENWLADPHPCETALKRGGVVLRGDADWLGTPVVDLVDIIFGIKKIEQEETKGAEQND